MASPYPLACAQEASWREDQPLLARSPETDFLLEGLVRLLDTKERCSRSPKESRLRYGKREGGCTRIVGQLCKQNPIMLAESQVERFQLASESVHGFAARCFPT